MLTTSVVVLIWNTYTVNSMKQKREGHQQFHVMDGSFCNNDQMASSGKATPLVVVARRAVSLLESSEDSERNGEV